MWEMRLVIFFVLQCCNAFSPEIGRKAGSRKSSSSSGTCTCEKLSCRVKGFYPFAEATRTSDGVGGVLGFLFKDTHQAIIVSSSKGSAKLFMDFMTEGGQSHPVWYNEAVKWNVLLGGNIRGEVRIREVGKVDGGGDDAAQAAAAPFLIPAAAASDGAPLGDETKLQSLKRIAARYDCTMNLYTSNCRIFAARMRREVERLNALDSLDAGTPRAIAAELAADARLAAAVLHAGLLPALYPIGVLLVCWDGLQGL